MKIQRQRINAKSASGDGGAVIKNMPEMRMAIGASYFGSVHAVTVVRYHFYAAGQCRIKAGPSATAVKFLFGSEERVAATGTNIYSRIVKLVIFSRERRLCSFMAQNVILFGGEGALCVH